MQQQRQVLLAAHRVFAARTLWLARGGGSRRRWAPEAETSGRRRRSAEASDEGGAGTRDTLAGSPSLGGSSGRRRECAPPSPSRTRRSGTDVGSSTRDCSCRRASSGACAVPACRSPVPGACDASPSAGEAKEQGGAMGLQRPSPAINTCGCLLLRHSRLACAAALAPAADDAAATGPVVDARRGSHRSSERQRPRDAAWAPPPLRL
jgi:hypothetical protein